MLALWEFFWDWAGTPSTPTPPDPTPGRGRGKNHNKPAYIALDDEYWAARAELAKPPLSPPEETIAERTERLHAEIRQILAEQTQLAQLKAEKMGIQQTLRGASSIDELKSYTTRSTELTTEIAKLEITNKARIIRAKSLRFSLYH